MATSSCVSGDLGSTARLAGGGARLTAKSSWRRSSPRPRSPSRRGSCWSRWPAGGDLVVGASMDEVNEALGRLASLLIVGGPLALGSRPAWDGSSPARRSVPSRDASRGRGHLRLRPRPPAPFRRHTGDGSLASARRLNEMLERLESAVERERQFVDEASHELRTPLANLERSSSSPPPSGTSAELQSALRSAADETERLARLAADLLVLARADGWEAPRCGPNRPTSRSSRMRPSRLRARVTPGVEIDTRDPVDLRDGRPDPHPAVLENLIDNATPHTPGEGA